MPSSDRFPTLTEPCMADTCAHEQVLRISCALAKEHEKWKCERPKDKCEIHLNRSAVW